MVKLVVFWGLFALVLLGVVATLIRDRRRRLKREAEEAKSGVAPVPVPRPPVKHAETPYDPTATRVHVRASPVDPYSALPQRKEVELSREAVPRLVCVGGSQKDHVFPVTAAGIRVGRAADNDIVITDPRASQYHAWVGIVGHKVVLRDLGSTNGTFLNALIDVPVSEVVLNPDDTIFFGGHGRDQFRLVVD